MRTGLEKWNLLKAKVHTLANDKDFKLIGIASHLSDYKISWLLNEELDFKFQQSEDITLKAAKSLETHKFSTYKTEDEKDTIYTLFSNRTDLAIFIKALKNIDFILKLEGEVTNFHVQELIGKIKKLRNILTVFEIDPNSLSSKERDLFIN